MDILFLPFLVLFVFFGVINCLIRGFKRSIVRLIFVILAAVIAYFLSKPLSALASVVVNSIWGTTFEALNTMLDGSATLQAFTQDVPSAVGRIFVYMILFGIFCLLMNIPVGIINRHTDRNKRGFGALFGILAGIIAFLLTFAPLLGVASIANDYLGNAKETSIAESIEEIFEDASEYTGKNFTISFDDFLDFSRIIKIGNIIGEPMLDGLTTVKTPSGKISVSKELKNIGPELPTFIKIIQDKDFEQIIKVAPDIIDTVEKSDLLSLGVVELVGSAYEKWNAGEVFHNIDPKDCSGFSELLVDYVIKNGSDFKISQLRDLINQINEILGY